MLGVRPHHRTLLAIASTLAAASAAGSAHAGDARSRVGTKELPAVDRVYWDSPDETGRFVAGGIVELPIELPASQVGSGPATWTTIMNNGPASNRVDLVFVGDGYTAGQLGTYAAHVQNSLDDFFSQNPFFAYAAYFNVHRVDVISNESGVDNDPTFGILRDTALDMAFWCGGIERLLCVNVGSAYLYAFNAPDVDQVLAVANASMYGGAGYSGSDLGTFAGGNFFAPEIAIHEMGHSAANLADEYDYGDGTVYTGPEPSERNISILTQSQMAAAGTKWAAWLNAPGIDNFEGAYYRQFGIYRPDFNSKMRSLGAPFNSPSLEAFIIEIYNLVDPLDDWAPTNEPLDFGDVAWVTPQQPLTPLAIQWSLDGEPIPRASDTSFAVASLGTLVGEHVLSVRVVDETAYVRDEAARDQHMTQVVSWTLSGLVDCNDNDVPDADEVASGASTDCNANGIPDECDTWPGYFAMQSTQLSPIGADVPQEWTISDAPEATGPVTITVLAAADLGEGERLIISLNATSLGSFFAAVGSDCPSSPDAETQIVTAADFNAAVNGGDAVFTITGIPTVDPFECDPPSWVSLAIEYTGEIPGPDCDGDGTVDGCQVLAGAPDANGDGILDACQCPADLSGNGAVDFADLTMLLLAWGPCPSDPTPCPSDIDGSEQTGFGDLTLLLVEWGECG